MAPKTPKAKTPQQVVSEQMPGWKIAETLVTDAVPRRDDAEAVLPNLEQLRRKFLGSEASATAPQVKAKPKRTVAPRGVKSEPDQDSAKMAVYRVTKSGEGPLREERVGIKNGKIILQTG